MYRNCDAQDLDESTGPPEHLQFFKIHTLTTDEKEPFLGFWTQFWCFLRTTKREPQIPQLKMPPDGEDQSHNQKPLLGPCPGPGTLADPSLALPITFSLQDKGPVLHNLLNSSFSDLALDLQIPAPKSPSWLPAPAQASSLPVPPEGGLRCCFLTPRPEG